MSETAVVGGEDRISALPLDVWLRVLSRLPADEAVRASLLSREWRGLWRKLPSLRLVHSRVFKSSDPNRFNKFVNHLLLLRGHLPLEKCVIWAYSDANEVDPYPYANLWIQYALICKDRMLDVVVDRDIHGLKLTVSLASEHLTTLNLFCVDLELCSGLVDSQLRLDFASCPLLVDLNMVRCNVQVHGISSESLKWLCATDCTFAGLGPSRTWIYAPSLVSLYLSDFILAAPVLESMPLLQSAFLRLSDSCGDTCGVTDPGVQNCGNQSCEGCHGYPAGEYQSVLLNGLSDAIHLELIAGSKVISILLPPSISTPIVVC